jgi:hypothetical protein
MTLTSVLDDVMARMVLPGGFPASEKTRSFHATRIRMLERKEVLQQLGDPERFIAALKACYGNVESQAVILKSVMYFLGLLTDDEWRSFVPSALSRQDVAMSLRKELDQVNALIQERRRAADDTVTRRRRASAHAR